jgi:hypothetical protein
LGWGENIPKRCADVPPALTAINRQSMGWLLLSIPLLHALNALYVNYLPLLNSELELMTTANSLLLIAGLRVPGMIAGIYYSFLSNRFSHLTFVISYTTIHFATTVLFISSPSYLVSCSLMMSSGLSTGLFYPASINLLNGLPYSTMVSFNSVINRRTAIFQFAACLLSLALLKSATKAPIYFLVLIVAFLFLAAVWSTQTNFLKKFGYEYR